MRRPNWPRSGCKWPPWGSAAVEEYRQSGAGDKGGSPGRLGYVLSDPKSAQDQREDQLGDEEGLDHRELSSVECNRLEGKSPRRRCPAEQPERLADQERDQSPVAVLARYADAGRVLSHEVCRIGQGSGQGKDDGHGHVMTTNSRFGPRSALS